MVRRTVNANLLGLVAFALIAGAVALRIGPADDQAGPAVIRAAVKHDLGAWLQMHVALAPAAGHPEYVVPLALSRMAPVGEAEKQDRLRPSSAAFADRAPPPGAFVSYDLC
jgi:hypothetical protein